jgi:hypothetical protein
MFLPSYFRDSSWESTKHFGSWIPDSLISTVRDRRYKDVAKSPWAVFVERLIDSQDRQATLSLEFKKFVTVLCFILSIVSR